MRICSLLPGATEVVAALGLTDHLVGISHECDYPPNIRTIPVMVDPLIEGDRLSSLEIDTHVRSALKNQTGLYRLRESPLAAARPDLIIAQDLCEVCAVTPAHLQQVIESLTPRPHLLTLNPHTLDDVLEDIERIGRAAGRTDAAHRLASDLRARLEEIRRLVAESRTRPRVACVEWLSPIYVAGHWVPDMVDIAGGIDVLATRGTPSRRVTWEALVEAAPDVLVIMPCGFTKERATREWNLLSNGAQWRSLAAVQNGRVHVVEALAYFSRPGPRLIDGVTQLAAAFHPDLGDAGAAALRRTSTVSVPQATAKT